MQTRVHVHVCVCVFEKERKEMQRKILKKKKEQEVRDNIWVLQKLMQNPIQLSMFEQRVNKKHHLPLKDDCQLSCQLVLKKLS